MALAISKDTSVGVPATYWRVISAHVDYVTMSMSVRLAGYATQAARDAGKSPIDGINVNFYDNRSPADPGPAFMTEPTRAAVYMAIKAINGWTDATDV